MRRFQSYRWLNELLSATKRLGQNMFLGKLNKNMEKKFKR